MQLFQSFILLIIGFVFLIKGADFFVDGSASIAKQLRVPSLIVGMTVVAMGTSLPECSVSVTASLAGNNSLAISNVVGSNIFNLLVVCGVCAIITPLAVHEDTRKRDFPVSIVCAILLFGGRLAGNVDQPRGRYRIYSLLCHLPRCHDPFCPESKSCRHRSCGRRRRCENSPGVEKSIIHYTWWCSDQIWRRLCRRFCI